VTYVLALINLCADYRGVNVSDPFVAADAAQLPSFDQARRDFERAYLVRILNLTRGNVTHAARLAGRNRTEFYRLLERHALSPGMFKTSPRRDGLQGEPAAEDAPSA
jgi:transcriptional regulator of acetoin/glycerol metabolism